VFSQINISSATNPISTIAIQNIAVKENAHQNWLGKLKIASLKKVSRIKMQMLRLYANLGGIFDHPVRKWFWFWLIFLAVGIILFPAALSFAFSGPAIIATVLYILMWASFIFSSLSLLILFVKIVEG
jgi:hypothetical protein